MARVSCVSIMLSLFVSSFAVAQGTTEMDKVVKFLEDHVIDKNFRSPLDEELIDNGKLAVVKSYTNIYTDLQKRKGGFVFSKKTIKTQTNYKLDKNGEKIEPGNNQDGIWVSRYVITERKSTGELRGIAFAMTGSGWERSVELEMTDGKLILKQQTATEYDDLYSADSENGWKPGIIKYEDIFEVLENGKTRITARETGFDYDIVNRKISDISGGSTLNVFNEVEK